MNAIPAIVNVLMVCMVFWLIFSILGVQLFKGKFYRCVDATTFERVDASVAGNKAACLANSSLLWRNAPIHFDNVASGFLALFQVVCCCFYFYSKIAAVDLF